jgi:hypothetical protein
MRNALLVLCLAAAPWLPGCQCLNWMAYVLAPSSSLQTVEPEFTALSNKTVAVVVFARPDILVEFDTAPVEISSIVSSELAARINGVSAIPPERILRYQDENPRWDSMPPGRLCRTFNSDYVLLISLIEFSTRERGSMHLARGRISAEAAVYSEDSPDVPLWRTDMIRVVYPETAPVGVPARDDYATRVNAERIFADKLVRKFYKHKIPRES